MATFLRVVNRMDQGYGVDIPLNAKEKTEHAFKILKEWPNIVKELHLKNIYDPKKGYNLQDKLSSNQSDTQLKIYEDIDKAAQKSVENILAWNEAFKPFKDKTNRLIHSSNAADLKLVETELVHSAKEHHEQKLT